MKKELVENEYFDSFLDSAKESLNERLSKDCNNEKLKDISDKLTKVGSYQEVTAFSFG